MPTGRGYAGICGVVAEVAWGTEVEVVERVPFRDEGITDVFQKIADTVLEGLAAPRASDLGMKDLGGALTTNLRYTNGIALLEHFFGDLTAGAYTMQEDLETNSLTMAIQKQVSVWTYVGVKCTQIVITGSPTDQVMVTYQLVAKDVDRASAINTTGVLAALADAAANILFTELNFRIGNLDDALAGGDEIGISEFTITIDRPMALDFTNQQRTILEPFDSGRRTGTLSFMTPRYTANTFQTFKDADTTLQARLYFDNSANTKEILLPEMKIMSISAPVGGPELVQQTIECGLYRNVNNGNMSTGSVEIEINET